MMKATEIGALLQSGHDGLSWSPIDAAPRDGTVLELKCSYGVAPWYFVGYWEPMPARHATDGWWRDAKLALDGVKGGVMPTEEDSLSWRPFTGEVASYVGPTQGAQNDGGYWRGAVAAKYGLPADHFEAEASKEKPSWWRRVFGA